MKQKMRIEFNCEDSYMEFKHALEVEFGNRDFSDFDYNFHTLEIEPRSKEAQRFAMQLFANYIYCCRVDATINLSVDY